MNTLSWMIYAADVVGNVKGAAQFLMIFSGIAAVSLGFFKFMNVVAPITEEKFPGVKIPVTVFAISMAVFVAAPSKDTVYAIAASEVGEVIVKSETAGKAMKALNAWIEQKAAEATKKGA